MLALPGDELDVGESIVDELRDVAAALPLAT
jgi:hypothetical protein